MVVVMVMMGVVVVVSDFSNEDVCGGDCVS